MNCDCRLVEIGSLGEVLIDLIPMEKGVSLAQARAFEKALGRAPANVPVGLGRLAIKTGFIGKVGDDEFGHLMNKA